MVFTSLIENNYMRSRVETLKGDLDRAEMRLQRAEISREETDRRYNELLEKYRQIQTQIMDMP